MRGPQRWLVLSGQIGMDQNGRLPGNPIEQFGLALANIERNLEAAGMRKADLLKLTIYLVGDMDSDLRLQVLSEWLGDHRPGMTLVYVAGLAGPEIRVELAGLASAGVG